MQQRDINSLYEKDLSMIQAGQHYNIISLSTRARPQSLQVESISSPWDYNGPQNHIRGNSISLNEVTHRQVPRHKYTTCDYDLVGKILLARLEESHAT